MARAIGRGHKIIGLIDCLACGKEMPAKETGGGKLSLCCTWCDLSLYVNPGTKAHELLLAKVKLDAPAPDPRTVTEASPPAPAPEPEKKDPPRRSFAAPLFGGS
jgi:hypothetical protein